MATEQALSPVAVTSVGGSYPTSAPYHPSVAYPEYGSERPLAGAPNPVYAGVRETLRHLGYDRERFGTPEWNPLGVLIQPGQRVFIKPNLVTHEYRASCRCQGDLFSVITHPSTVRAIADYAAIALKGRGEIVIGDNPSVDADFGRILDATALDRLPDFYAQHFATPCRVLDLRPRRTTDLKYYGYRSHTTVQEGDPEGSALINLGRRSLFHGLNPLLFRGVYQNRWETIRHHLGSVHRYSISNTMMNADVFISVPKLKAHHKVGATLNIKGLVGTVGNKNLLVHWRLGYPGNGGDEFPVAHRSGDQWRLGVQHALSDLLPERLYLFARDHFVPRPLADAFTRKTKHSYECYRGAWDGNDTCWRMAADLYNVFVADRPGYRRKPVRFFSLVDGVMAGEGDGPFCPMARPAGVLVAGEDLLTVDAVCARFMDFRVEEIRYLRHLLAERSVDLRQVPIISEAFDFGGCFENEALTYGGFRPPAGWPRLSSLPVAADRMTA